jgi:hypothetical protein
MSGYIPLPLHLDTFNSYFMVLCYLRHQGHSCVSGMFLNNVTKPLATQLVEIRQPAWPTALPGTSRADRERKWTDRDLRKVRGGTRPVGGLGCRRMLCAGPVALSRPGGEFSICSGSVCQVLVRKRITTWMRELAVTWFVCDCGLPAVSVEDTE